MSEISFEVSVYVVVIVTHVDSCWHNSKKIFLSPSKPLIFNSVSNLWTFIIISHWGFSYSWKLMLMIWMPMNNSSPPSAIYMWWGTWLALDQVMACRLSGAKPFPNQCCLIVIGTLGINSSLIQIQMKNFSFMKMPLKLIWKKTSILSRGRWDKWLLTPLWILHLYYWCYYGMPIC